MYNTSTNYKNTVLADSTKHVLKLYIGQRQLEPNHIFDFTMNIEMFSDEIYLGATPMKSCSFKIYKDEIQSGDTEIRVVSGIEGEEIPMGTYVFEDIKEVDFFTYEITAVDYMYKFEGAYVTDLDFSEGVTLLEVLNDLCEKSDVILGSESFLNDDTVIAVYDSTLQRKEYLSYIAEQAGGFAIIGRDNKLYIKTFNHTENASELNLNNFKSFKWGQSIDISKIAYEDGIQDFKKGDDSGSTLWIAQKNMYVTSQSQIDNIYDELTETEREIEEEGTSITIEDSKEGTKIDYSIKGNTTQDGTPTPSSPVSVNNVAGEQIVEISGENILKESSLTSAPSSKANWHVDQMNNVTSYSFSNNGMTVTTPTTGNSNNGKAICLHNANTLIPAGTQVTFSVDITGSAVSGSIKGFYRGNGAGYWSNSFFIVQDTTTTDDGTIRYSGTFTMPNVGTLNTSFYIVFAQGMQEVTTRTYKNATLLINSTKKEYIPYESKIYPINLSGINLLDIQTSWVNSKNSTQGGLHYILNEDDTISISGTSTGYSGTYARNYNSTDVFMTLKANHKYRILAEVSNKTSNINSRVYFGTTSANIGGFSLTSIGGNGTYYKDYTPTQDVGLTQYSIIGAESAGETSLTMKIAIYDVTTNLIDKYIKYFTPIELNKIGNYQDFIRKGIGKNLADTEKINLGYSLNDDGSLSVSPIRSTIFQVAVKPSTKYSLSVASNYQIGNLFYYKEDKTLLSMVSSGWGNNKIVTIPSKAYYISFATRVSTNATMVENDLTNLHIQIEENSSVTYYEPYGYKDKWYIEKNVEKVVLNENTTIYSNSAFLALGRFNIPDCIGIKGSASQPGVVSTHFKGQFEVSNGCAFLSGTDNKLNVVNTDFINNLAGFKTWLGTNKPIVYYIKQNTDYILIDNEELLNQLDELDNATLMEGTTNILVSGNLPFIMNLDFDIKNRNFYQFEGGSIVDPANDLGDVVIIDEKPVIFEGKMSYLGKWYIDVNSTALVKDKAHSMNTKTDTRAKIRRVESQINQIEGEITQVVEATEEISKDYVTNSEYTTYKTEATQSMSELSQQVSRTVETLYGENDDGLVKRVEKTETDISQNAGDITLSVKRISSLETKTEELNDNTKKIVKSFKFNDDGLTISNQGSDEDDGANINIDSEDIKIRIGTATKLLINGSGIYYDSASFNKLDLGEFAIVAEENGFLSIIYEGGN